jgi:O-methyltransferase
MPHQPSRVKRMLKQIVNSLGYDLTARTASSRAAQSADMSPEVLSIIEQVLPFTMTSPERIAAVCSAAEYVVRASIPGDFVECGVWRGGSTMAAALSFLHLGRKDIQLFLFDTFAGMTEPTSDDRDVRTGEPAMTEFSRMKKRNEGWCEASKGDVSSNLASSRYPAENIHLIEGRVENTIPEAAPAAISLLRLDTDWYESTRHEMEHLFPRLAPGGVLIIDDYGHWAGSRKAVDEYFATNDVQMLLNRIDYTGRIGIKP